MVGTDLKLEGYMPLYSVSLSNSDVFVDERMPAAVSNPLCLLSSENATKKRDYDVKKYLGGFAETGVQDISLHHTFSLTKNALLEEMLLVTGLDVVGAMDLVLVIERRQEEQYTFCLLRSAANSERWYDKLKEYLSGYGINVTKKFQPQNPELAQIAAKPLRQEHFYGSCLSLRELRAHANPNLPKEKADPVIEHAMGRRIQPVY